MNITTCQDFFIAFSAQYQNMNTYGIWFELHLEKASFGIKFSDFPSMILNHLKLDIKHIDTNYPQSVCPGSPGRVSFLLFVHAIIWLVFIIFSYGTFCAQITYSWIQACDLAVSSKASHHKTGMFGQNVLHDAISNAITNCDNCIQF